MGLDNLPQGMADPAAGIDESPALSPKELVEALEIREATAFAAYKEALEYSNLLMEYWSETCTQLYAARDKEGVQ